MKSNNFFRIALSVFVSFVFVFAVTYAATTISTSISTGGTLTVNDTSTLTGAVTLGTDLTVTSGTRVGADASGGHITALADDSLFVEGQSEFDGTSWFDGSLRASSTLMATGAAILYSTLDVTGKTTLANASSTILTVSGNTYLATTTLSSGGSLTLGTLAADPSSATNGQMYYSTGSGAIRVYQGSSWTTLGAANGWTDGGATVYPTAMADQFLIGTTSVSGLSQLTVEATSTAGIPLTLRGFTGQTANLFVVENVGGTDLFTIDALGRLTSNLDVNGYATTTASNGNFATKGALSVTNLSTLLGGATTTILTLLNGEIISNGTDGVIQLGGVASTTSITLLNGETITNATDGTIALTGALTVSSVSSFTGLATLLDGATTTTLTLLNGEIISNGTDGVIQLGGIASTTSLTLLNGETITNATDGEVQITATTLKLIGTASTSAIKVGDEPATPEIQGMVFGYCSFGNVTLAASSTEGFANCTTVPVGALLANDRVFVQATSSFESMYVITAASTTGVSTIQLRILNTGLGVADGELTGTSINFWAVR